MRIVWSVIFLSVYMLGDRVVRYSWPANYTVTSYLHDNNITLSVNDLPSEIKRSFRSIKSGETIYELKENGKLKQSLIALNDKKQIHITSDHNGSCRITIEPIVYHQMDDVVDIRVGKGFGHSLISMIHNPKLPYAISSLVGDKKLMRSLQSDSYIVFEYSQKERLGKPHGNPVVKSVLIKKKNTNFFIFRDETGKRHSGIYDKIPYTVMEKRPFTYTTIKKIPAPNFRMPVAHPRITSPFSLRRWHPVLHKYKPHYGVDFGGKVGTPLYATDEGTVIYAGWMSGYGKTTKIRHAGGFVSLYGHQNKIFVRNGMKVKRGSIIGKMGNTGRSTGPHMHYGLYLRGRPVDPMKYIGKKPSRKPKIIRKKHTVIKEFPVKKYRKKLIPYARRTKEKLGKYLRESNSNYHIWNKTDCDIIFINDIMVDKKSAKGVEDG